MVSLVSFSRPKFFRLFFFRRHCTKNYLFRDFLRTRDGHFSRGAACSLILSLRRLGKIEICVLRLDKECISAFLVSEKEKSRSVI